jgi:coenzyme PQQ biosynthesis protein C
MTEPVDADELERRLRQIGHERYHDKHPFHRKLHAGELNRGQLQAWVLNRYYYQSRIPLKDAALLSRVDDRAFRREWIRRILDHDGESDDSGGIERWLVLAEGVGLDREAVQALKGVLPATRFAVDAYVRFVREVSLLEAVASSLTELFAPRLHESRISALLANYDFANERTLAYFQARLSQAPRDVEFGLAFVKREARTCDQQEAALAALRFKTEVLWAQLDALHFAYVEPAFIPPGAFVPDDRR